MRWFEEASGQSIRGVLVGPGEIRVVTDTLTPCWPWFRTAFVHCLTTTNPKIGSNTKNESHSHPATKKTTLFVLPVLIAPRLPCTIPILLRAHMLSLQRLPDSAPCLRNLVESARFSCEPPLHPPTSTTPLNTPVTRPRKLTQRQCGNREMT